MPEGAKVDIQPGPKDIHDKLNNVGKPGHKALADIVLPDGSQLVPPGQDEQNLKTATEALHAVAGIITGDTSPVSDERQYIYKSTSRHVARSRPQNATKPTLGRLRRNNNVGFMFDCSGIQFCFRYLKAHELADAHASLLGGHVELFGGILGALGDLCRMVVNGIANSMKFVIETARGVVKATVTFVVNKITRVWQGVIDTASKAADLAIFVFASVNTAVGKVIDWVKFWFDWNDIKLTARAFRGYMDGIGLTLQVIAPPQLSVAPADIKQNFIDNTLVKVNNDVFEYARKHVDPSADAVIATLGKRTMDSFDLKSKVTSRVVPAGISTGPELGIAAGSRVQDILDQLSTAAMYFFDVVYIDPSPTPDFANKT